MDGCLVKLSRATFPVSSGRSSQDGCSEDRASHISDIIYVGMVCPPSQGGKPMGLRKMVNLVPLLKEIVDGQWLCEWTAAAALSSGMFA